MFMWFLSKKRLFSKHNPIYRSDEPVLFNNEWRKIQTYNEDKMWLIFDISKSVTVTKHCLCLLFQRQEDGLPGLLDLPKECIIEIMMKLSDHRDLIHLGTLSCSYHKITQ